ncbi:MAG: Rne/Rng family ribonuclease [Gemmatimonadota bacterium]|nr:Rne/Rng family ribonuclease [Gemmatimonadota bacterium]
MKREILISASDEQSWVALKEDGRLTELMFDRPDQDRLVGDIFLGRVEAVLPGIQAAFVDIGEEKAAFLHASDLGGVHENGNGEGQRGRARDRQERDPPPVQDVLTRGQKVLVKVTKEAISTKGPRVTTQISLPGRFLVYIPDSSQVGVSRKIDHRRERSRLRAMAREVVDGGSGGVIVRTAGEELTPKKLAKEYRQLHSRWKMIERKAEKAEAPSLIHAEAKLISGVIRDLFTNRFDAVTIDNRTVYEQIVEYVRAFDPVLPGRIHYYDDREHLFDHAGIEKEMQRSFRRRVDLPSGGYVIIEPTEALVSIDVNTGRFTGRKKDPEHTILKTNLDAAREIATQLRLRDIGGIIVIDFIDMESQENRDRVLHELRTHLGRDRARTRTWEVSELGLIEMTRQRVRPSLLQSLTEPCTACSGSGHVWTAPTLVREIERSVCRAGVSGEKRQILIRLHPKVALQIMESEPRFVRRLSRRARLSLDIRDDPLMRPDEFRLLCGRAEEDVTDRYRSA